MKPRGNNLVRERSLQAPLATVITSFFDQSAPKSAKTGSLFDTAVYSRPALIYPLLTLPRNNLVSFNLLAVAPLVIRSLALPRALYPSTRSFHFICVTNSNAGSKSLSHSSASESHFIQVFRNNCRVSWLAGAKSRASEKYIPGALCCICFLLLALVQGIVACAVAARFIVSPIDFQKLDRLAVN